MRSDPLQPTPPVVAPGAGLDRSRHALAAALVLILVWGANFSVQKAIFEALSPGGFLFVGHSETLSDHHDLFDQVRHGGILQYRKRGDIQ